MFPSMDNYVIALNREKSGLLIGVLRIDTGDKAWKAFDAKQASFYNTSCGYIHVVYTK